MVKHVSVRNKSVCLDTLYLDAEDATGDHHADLGVLFQGELAIVGHLVADSVIVLLDVTNLLADLVLEGAAFQPGALFLRVEDGEVVECFW